MKHLRIVYGFIAILGIAFLTVFFPNPILFPMPNLFSLLTPFIGSLVWILFSCFFSIVGVVFLTAGMCGIGSRCFKNNQNLTGKPTAKHTRLYGPIAVLGIVFLGMLFAIGYWGSHSNTVARFFQSNPLSGFLVFTVFLFGGTTLLTAGACGIVRQCVKNNRSLLTVLTAILIPSLILMTFVYMWVSSLQVGF